MSANANGASRGGLPQRARGGARAGAPKKGGPRPARHIPWPEIFKHHISLVEGHLKMIDMVRKHTVEGSGNQRTIQNLIDRAHTMLKDARAVQREFIPPRDAWQKVPIGSSSDTMYPGYSPKDHEYGKAAQEFGKQWSEARKAGVEFDAGPDGPEYQFGQSKASKRRRLNETAGMNGTDNGSSSSEKGVDADTAVEAENTGGDPLFFVDSNPTPVNGLHKSAQHSQAKTESKVDDLTAAANEQAKPVVEYENIDREVDARLKLRADAEKNKKDRKRKRESSTSAGVPTEADASEEHPPEKKSRPKKKKKSKTQPTADEPKESVDAEMEDTSPKSGLDEDANTRTEAVAGDSETSKKTKKNKGSSDDTDADRKRKKHKKNKHKD